MIELNKKDDYYPVSIENIFIGTPSTVYPRNCLKSAVILGIDGRTADVSGAVKGNKDKIIEPIVRVFDLPNYWEDGQNPEFSVSRIKIALDKFIAGELASKRVVSINDMYTFLKGKPYGFLDTAISGFLLGFMLKDYIAAGSYHYKHKTGDEPLSSEKLIGAIEAVIKQSAAPSNKDEVYEITRQSDEANAFSSASIEIFGINDKSVFVSRVIDGIRDKVRRSRLFPLFVLNEVVKLDTSIKDKDTVCKAIELYCGVLNSQNFENGQDNEYKLANELGALFMKNKDIAVLLKQIVSNTDAEKSGIKSIVDAHKGGKLAKLASDMQIDYIPLLSAKFTKNESSGNWSWDKTTALEQIDKLILELEIIAESKKCGVVASSESELVEKWSSRLDDLKISFDAVSGFIECGDLLYAIADMVEQRNISQLEKLLGLFQSQGAELLEFLNNQAKYFKKILEPHLDELEDPQQIDELMTNLVPAQFGVPKERYLSYCKKEISEFKSGLASQRLKTMFRQKTGYSSPQEWSSEKETPILIFASKSERSRVKAVFDMICENNSSESVVDDAIKCLDGIKWWDDLKVDAELDAKFRDVIIGKYSKIISVKEVRKHLLSLRFEPYFWSEDAQVTTEIVNLAKANYIKDGAKRAMEEIDKMTDYTTLKTYLKELVENNMEVGVSIINEEK